YFIRQYPTYLDSYKAMNPPTNVSDYQLGGRLIPRSLVESNPLGLAAALRCIKNNGGIVSGVSITVSQKAKTAANSVNPNWRDIVFDTVLGTRNERNKTIMRPPFPSPTPTWHNETYSAISPSRPELSVAGKTVVVTGAGSGIGRETAFAFVNAGAKQIALLGRNEQNLMETKNQLSSNNTSCSTYTVDVVDEKVLKDVAAAVGTWDVLILSAGFVSSPASIAETAGDDWWQNFEINVKGTMTTARAFLPTANPSHAAVLGVTTGVSALPPAMLPGLSAYISSKLAQVKFLEFLGAENPNLFVASVHPGMVDTTIFRKSGAQPDALPMDKDDPLVSRMMVNTDIGLLTVQLPAHFMVWLVSPEAAFLKGRLVWANWDVDELKSQAQEIQSGQQMTAGIVGWPYPHVG
ncbi:MAG: hypothetical protein Q9187_004638, partial [Circinaria calcarea]